MLIRPGFFGSICSNRSKRKSLVDRALSALNQDPHQPREARRRLIQLRNAQQWQRHKFRNLADGAALVLFIPFTRTQEDNLRLIQRALRRHAAKQPHTLRATVRNSAYTIDYTGRHQLLSRWEHLALVRFRAVYCQEELWRVGAPWHQEN